MLREMNEGVIMNFKTITMNLLTILHPLVEPITSLAKLKDYLEAYIYVSQIPWTVNSINPVIYTSLFSFFFFVSMLISNGYWWITLLSYFGNSYGLCRGRNTTGEMKCTTSRNCLSIIDLINERYVLLQGTSISFKRIVEEILSKSFR